MKRRYGLVFGVEEVMRVELVVPEELEHAPAHAIRAGTRRNVDERRGLASELCRILRLLDLEFLDRIDRRVDHEVVEQFVGDLCAVE
jgi:hypothetical protein